MSATTDDETVLREVLERWRTAVDAHRPQDVAAVFTEDALFQGLHPYGVGRDAVAAYYAAQPPGMRAGYRILETRRYADDLVLGYLDVAFTFTDRDPVAVKLAVLARRQEDGWALAHYQVSRLGR
ncbi:SgcJ/EcaC family oxidoreductase [Streptomyces sp. NPDC046859]|uniref:SgcJ/EcaC family oxidoreductase n=1 Tax=Streptomyces sp. NPDC046859 TaxID=3155734 RepID=UPI0033C9B4F0